MGAAVNPAYINLMVISFNGDPFRDGLCKMGKETVPRMLSKVSENLDGVLQ
jgi:hypothetical protein